MLLVYIIDKWNEYILYVFLDQGELMRELTCVKISHEGVWWGYLCFVTRCIHTWIKHKWVNPAWVQLYLFPDGL